MIFSQSCRVFLWLLCAGFLIVPADLWAQEKLNVRTGAHEDYSRLVFDWPRATTYKISKSGGVLSLSFDKAATFDFGRINTKRLANIGTLSVSSEDPLTVSIQIAPDSRFRHFKIGNRVVVDVYNASGEPSREAAIPQNKKSEESQDNLEAMPAASVEASPITGMRPHVITISTTKNIGLALFERAGFIWLVVDDPDLKVPPTISGPNRDELPELEALDLVGGQAYRMKKPQGEYYFYGEGGGLLWRIVMTPNPRRTTPVKPESKYDDPASMGGSLVWPLNGVRKILSVTDPVIGDEIQVITVEDSSRYTGDPRQFVELETLPSMIGLALVAKADDIKIASAPTGVTLTRPQGLALSSKRDTAPVILKDDVQKEEEAFTAEEKKKKMSRIFNFARWEMGGLQPLEENRRVLMVSMAAKEGHAKVEDLITLAKLNVANDRGQEALGLLRVAANELPGIEESAEFIALRGAAGTLAGKYDESIEDLAAAPIQQYDEIGYWKAFALAGLEDWRQADSVMPTDFDLLADYPKQIRQPVTLALTEVALRAGKTNIAQNLMALLESELKELSLPRQSAWKYLKGELERQLDQPDEALENWNPLLVGRDDYYRAKAGLAVTKLQLARQKITPDKAIDRLEGLRYAWRGDELETLINLRLGEVYIDNENYLKGLSVLRNAVSMSPRANITQEVTDYMTSTFRSLFTEDKLKDVSPLDAVTIYDEFKELTPIGAEGDAFIQELAERLVEVDLLGRASALLEHQLNHRLQGEQAGKVAIRLVAIRLLDNKPEGALRSLDVAEDSFKQGRGTGPKDYRAQKREIKLLRARALSKINRTNEALAILRSMDSDLDVIKLRADVAWNGGMWEEAAQAFESLIVAENISKTRPMNEYQTNLVLNRSIALNLAGNRVVLAELREQYGDLMAQSEKSRLFDLVTRPRQLGLVSNRDSVMSLISEVDLFGEFLESYKKIN